jgi:hypothetical protein
MVVTGLAFAAYFRCLDHWRALKRNADDIVRALKAGERWRADIRAATAMPKLEEIESEQALHIPHGSGEIVYLFTQDEVWRLTNAPATGQPLLSQVRSSRMGPDARQQVTAWRWELELKTRKKDAKLQPLFTFEAVASVKAKP